LARFHIEAGDRDGSRSQSCRGSHEANSRQEERWQLMVSIPRSQYADMYGPTTGDKIQLADTNLIIEIEKDFTVYGDENQYGGGKSARDGMGLKAGATHASGALDLVITN